MAHAPNKHRIAMILAMDSNKLIGKAGGMLWHIPGELAYFKKVTMGKPVVMGRKTFDSIGKALPGRTNLVVTRNSAWSAPDVVVCPDLETAMQKGADACATLDANIEPEVMIIGGAALCRDAMPHTSKLYLTVIDAEYEGDTWLDSYHPSEWHEVSRDDQQHESLMFSYRVLERK